MRVAQRAAGAVVEQEVGGVDGAVDGGQVEGGLAVAVPGVGLGGNRGVLTCGVS